jgi:hypothetical protein|tara:strand:- start:345 stop:788 length:444 start_codon:yes stop_codon:yes gene_type:complete
MATDIVLLRPSPPPRRTPPPTTTTRFEETKFTSSSSIAVAFASTARRDESPHRAREPSRSGFSTHPSVIRAVAPSFGVERVARRIEARRPTRKNNARVRTGSVARTVIVLDVRDAIVDRREIATAPPRGRGVAAASGARGGGLVDGS